jgi:hypothetical protein
MTTVRRSYIRPAYEQAVDDGCLEYKSIPMAVVSDVLKISHSVNEYTGIKQIYNLIPPRPKDINTMAVSIARIGNLTYNSAVPKIAQRFIDEEVSETRQFVANAPRIENESIPYQAYTPEQPTQSSLGTRLEPVEIATSTGTQTYFRKSTGEMNTQTERKNLDSVSFILGDIAPTSGVVPMNTGISAQTEWFMEKQAGYNQRDMVFGVGEASAKFLVGGTETMTQLFKPPSGSNLPFGIAKTKLSFFEGPNPEDRKGTLGGTPMRQLPRPDKAQRIAEIIGPQHTPIRPSPLVRTTSSGFTISQETSGESTPIPDPRKINFGSY